ncbi:acetyltransferase [Pseudomonas taeanensis MS-3]|uniref:Acetyltransferase n=2 Tax=Pseudomonas taeanensis TaxID=574962 RepID=A0A0A1YMM3_9PSED|nr:acetyltransferase [Pseudomonas taeanensis MS-3]
MLAEKNIRLDVQGLRAVAVLAVIIYHVNKAWLPSGFVGVDVFFVISGFIITSLIVGRKENFDWKGFYWGRVKRIAPAYFLMLAVVALVSAVLFLPADFKFFKDSLKAALSFTSNSYFEGFGSYFAPRAHELPLLHTWSLAIEMQFYLFLPVLVCFLPARLLRPVFVLLGIGLLAWSEYKLFNKSEQAVYFSLVARFPEFLIGAFVALLPPKNSLPMRYKSLIGAGGALLLALSVVFIDVQHFPGMWTLLPCIGTALLIAARHGPVSTLLAAKPMVWVGGVSYSLYLWHWPILAFIRYYTGQYELQMVWLAVFVISSLVVAWLSYRWVELPVRHVQGIRTVQKKMLAIAVCVFAVIGVSKEVNVAVVDKLPVEMTRYAPSDEICHGKVVGDCTRGYPGSSPRVLVIGDSHAAQLNYFFDAVGVKNEMAFRVITASSCVPITGFDVERLPLWAQDSCRSQIETVDALMAEADVIVLAGMWQYQTQSDEFMLAFSRFIEAAAEQNKRVFVLAQIPMFDTNFLRIHRFIALGLPVQVTQNNEWKSANSKIEAAVHDVSSAQFLDFSESEFFASAPFENNLLIYLDNHHLNESGARRYGQYAASFFQKNLLKIDN